MKIPLHRLQKIIAEEVAISQSSSEGLRWHIQKGVPFDEPVYRAGTDKYFSLMREARDLYQSGGYTPKTSHERDLLESSLGDWGHYRGQRVPLDFPQRPQLHEAEYKGRDVELNKPKRGSGGKAYVYVRNDKGNVIKVTFGSSMPDAMGDSEEAKKRRKSFGERHKCSEKKDKTKAGYWSCRATKFFGRDIPGWW